MKKRVFLVVMCMATLFAVTPLVSAQTAETVQAAQTEETDEYKETLGKMLKLSGSLTTSENMVPQMISMMKQSMPTVPDSYWDSFAAKWKLKAGDKLIGLFVPVYKKYLTLDDLKEIIVFYESPVGKKLAASTPGMTMEGVKMGQKLGQEIVSEMQKELQSDGYN